MQSKLYKLEDDKILSEVLKEIEHICISLTTALDTVVVAEELLKGIFFRAPIAGFVNQISKRTYLASREAQMSVAETTPLGQDFVTEVSIEAQHIDRVHIGQLSRLKFISFRSRTSPKCPVLWFPYRLILPILF